ncbi:hypothetical protein BBW65_05865 [Helicobacter enhydrae]|uniref:Cj1289-like C-terminal domain-containing protein n=2 Tax=Helicobacter enhydrae TaxID=222136 RepID=A0A1B1U6J0_9HELI|nr:hypothetical protein BBW65_05865 [Helicobacter enhydrae]
MYEITQMMQQKKVSQKEARRLLILNALKKQEIQRMQIEADEISIDQQIDAAANMKGVSRDEFVANMVSDGYSYEELRSFYQNYVQEELLVQKILSNNIKIVDEKELKRYYETHQDEFSMPKEVTIVQYISQNPKALARAMNNPSSKVSGVEKREERVVLKGINPNIAQMFAQTPKGQFTQIVNNGGMALAFFIKDKQGNDLMPFDQIKPMIMQQVVLSRKDKILQEYYDRLLASAIIVEIRN